MEVIKRDSALWQYMPEEIRGLLEDGELILNFVHTHHQEDNISDYSFLVFPFAKAYEGVLKQIFRDKDLISRLDYISDHLRLGKLMSPNLIGKLGDKSLYKKIQERYSQELADKVWNVWKSGRNQIFHYFPHNFKAISFNESRELSLKILKTMEEAYSQL